MVLAVFETQGIPRLGLNYPPGGSKWIISVGDYVDNSFTALGSSNPREVRLELYSGFYVFQFRFVNVHFVFC